MNRRGLFARLLAAAVMPFVGKPKPLEVRPWMCGNLAITKELLDDACIAKEQLACLAAMRDSVVTANEARALHGRPPYGQGEHGQPVPA